ncbi:hypothetical protein [Lewinella sp. IMCC34191]|uniref:hypothetical protein n=1 Tax=Lewinella sp. IMCC34191 TaxID=2259172 RepID=UPI000E266486|nr:hypothetical protein [Lewinella sp. IMCC34191]
MINSHNTPLPLRPAWWIILLICCWPVVSRAQVIPGPADEKHQIGLGFGFDHALPAVHLQYSRQLPGRSLAVSMRLSQAMSLLGSGNFGLRLGLDKWWQPSDRFAIAGGAALRYTRADNLTGTYQGLGYTLHLSPLLRAGAYTVGPRFAFTSYPATRIVHSDYSQEYLYADARDGWYGTTSNLLRFGAVLSRTIGRQEITLTGGFQTSGQFDRLLPPLYFNFLFNLRLP